MNTTPKAALVLVAVGALMAAAPSPLITARESPVEAAFERLKSLAGTWEGIEQSSRRPTTATYTLTGGGKVVLEVMGGMATAYHLDNDALVLTHFCGAGNQPRMRARAIDDDGRPIAFAVYDITNHPDPDRYYSSALDVRFLDDGTVALAYRGMTAGRESTQRPFT